MCSCEELESNFKVKSRIWSATKSKGKFDIYLKMINISTFVYLNIFAVQFGLYETLPILKCKGAYVCLDLI